MLRRRLEQFIAIGKVVARDARDDRMAAPVGCIRAWCARAVASAVGTIAESDAAPQAPAAPKTKAHQAGARSAPPAGFKFFDPIAELFSHHFLLPLFVCYFAVAAGEILQSDVLLY
jgi:hypothetical protein